MADAIERRRAGAETTRIRVLRMVRQLPAQAIDPDVGGQRARARHLRVAVVPVEQDVAPVEKRQIASGAALFVRHRTQCGYRHVESSTLTIFHVAVRRRAVD